MRRLRFIPRKDFQKDLKELARIDKAIIDDVMADIDLLCENHQLPAEFMDHALTGRLEGYRDFHVRTPEKGKSPVESNDVVVIYRIVENKLIVVGLRVGSHSKLFNGLNSSVKYKNNRLKN